MCARARLRGPVGRHRWQHSCDPNCRVCIGSIDEGSTITLKTTGEVQAGAPLTISYVPVGRSVAERRSLLAFQHGFTCACQRCTVEAAVETLRQPQPGPDEGRRDAHEHGAFGA